jgi:hypothetical protein
MTPTEILTVAAARGFTVGLNRTGDGLILWPGDDPPADLVHLIRGAKPEIVAVLQAERGRINRWIADRLVDCATAVGGAASRSSSGKNGPPSGTARSLRAFIRTAMVSGWRNRKRLLAALWG